MVVSVSNFSRNGLSDFLLQRLTAVVIAAYVLCVLGFLWLNPNLTFNEWISYMDSIYMRIFSSLTLFSIAAHAWIGLWTVSTDYLNEHHFRSFGNVFRWFFQLFVIVAILIYVLLGLWVIW